MPDLANLSLSVPLPTVHEASLCTPGPCSRAGRRGLRGRERRERRAAGEPARKAVLDAGKLGWRRLVRGEESEGGGVCVCVCVCVYLPTQVSNHGGTPRPISFSPPPPPPTPPLRSSPAPPTAPPTTCRYNTAKTAVLYLYVNVNRASDFTTENDFMCKVAIHEYQHLLQQGFLSKKLT